MAARIEAAIDYDRDFDFDFFGFKTLERSYLLRVGEERRVVERPQHLFMRVALGIHSRPTLDLDVSFLLCPHFIGNSSGGFLVRR